MCFLSRLCLNMTTIYIYVQDILYPQYLFRCENGICKALMIITLLYNRFCMPSGQCVFIIRIQTYQCNCLYLWFSNLCLCKQ